MTYDAHGGPLVNRLADGSEADYIGRNHSVLPRIELDIRAQTDLMCLATGVYSPLTGFMDKATYTTVLENMRLPDGTVWPLPITLPVSAEQASALTGEKEVVLVDAAGDVAGMMRPTQIYEVDVFAEALAVFGTTDTEHPGVAAAITLSPYRLAGDIVALPGTNDARMLTPAQTRQTFADLGWRTVVAFQTRNPIHRAHEYIQKSAMEIVDGLLLHPLVGETKSDDVEAAIRLRSYEAILSAYYPRDRALLALFPAYMRYAGPKEAVFHALCRKNYGVTHFIVGRDHAGVGNYYGTYDAQRIFDRFSPDELGMTLLFFEHTFYCRSCGQMASAKTCPHDADAHVILSGTKVRAMLREGVAPPPEFTRPEVAQLLMDHMTAPISG